MSDPSDPSERRPRPDHVHAEEVSEADRLEQEQPVDDEEEELTAPEVGMEVPEADAVEQAQDAGPDDDERDPPA